MTEQQQQELKGLKVKFGQLSAMVRQTFDNSPRPDTSSWADDLQKQTEILNGLAIQIQEVFEREEEGTQ